VKGGFAIPNPVRKEHSAPGGATRLRIATLALACAFVVGATAPAALAAPIQSGSLGNQRT
jgi:hypothetical protein